MSDRMVVAARVTEAREEFGIDKATLADLSGVSRVSISKIENGINKTPTIDTIYKLACVLRRPVEFFYTPMNNNYTETTEIAFRSYRSQTQKFNKKAKVKLKRAEELVAYLYDYIAGRCIDFDIAGIMKGYTDISATDIEAIAEKTREAWGISDGPIIKLTTFLENHGIICSSVKLPNETASLNRTIKFNDLDSETAIIVYNPSLTYYRQRFSLAHELGHIILHHDWDEDDFKEKYKLAEEQANLFASAFLMPYSTFVDSVTSITISGAFALKDIWKTSISSICMRMHATGIITDQQYTNLNIEISKRRWRTSEPGDNRTPVEKPYFLEYGYRTLFTNNIVSPSDVLRATGLLATDVIPYVGNEEFFMPIKADLNFNLK